jgi:hypothetical protein
MGLIVSALRETGMYDNTLIIVTAVRLTVTVSQPRYTGWRFTVTVHGSC